MNYIVILVSVFLNASAQICIKKGMMSFGSVKVLEINYFYFIFGILKNPFLMLGLICYGFSVLAWMIALSNTEVSFAYPFLSIGYILTLFFGYYFFNESITILRIVGIFFILVGVVFVAKSA